MSVKIRRKPVTREDRALADIRFCADAAAGHMFRVIAKWPGLSAKGRKTLYAAIDELESVASLLHNHIRRGPQDVH